MSLATRKRNIFLEIALIVGHVWCLVCDLNWDTLVLGFTVGGAGKSVWGNDWRIANTIRYDKFNLRQKADEGRSASLVYTAYDQKLEI